MLPNGRSFTLASNLDLSPAGAGEVLARARHGGTVAPAKRRKLKAVDCVAAWEGLEPPTSALGKRCSILLSYQATQGGITGFAARAEAPRRALR